MMVSRKQYSLRGNKTRSNPSYTSTGLRGATHLNVS